MHVGCEGLSDLGNGPNWPAATIIGECSASLQYAALILSLVRVRNSGFGKKSSHNFDNTSLISDIFLVCMVVVEGCQTLVMDPTSPLQQSLVNTVPHCNMLH